MSFRYYKPKEKINKLSEYFDLLDSLFRLPRGYSEDELLHHIEHTKGTGTPEPDYIFNTLLNYGLITESNDFQPRYVLGLPYRSLLEHLYQDSQPVHSEAIRGFIKVLEVHDSNLRESYEQKSAGLSLKHLQLLRREVESISETSARNRLGVINEVRKLRLNDDQLSYKERLSEVNRLWDEYLEPLREMIAPTGSFGQMMQQLKQTLNSGEALFSSSVELRHQFALNRSYRMQLQEQARHDLNEASAELDPLRQKLIEESRLLGAASLVFEHLEQDRLNDLPTLSIGRKLIHERQVRLYGLTPWLADLWLIQSNPESFQFDEHEEMESDPLEADALQDLLSVMPADTDLIDYFQQRYADLSANAILRAISIAALHQSEVSLVMTEGVRMYTIGGHRWQGYSFQKIDNRE